MISKAGSPRCHRFLNISAGETIRMDLPELAEHRFLSPTPEGLILLLHEATLVVRLLNPLIRQLIDLPPVNGLMTLEQRRSMRLFGPTAFEVDFQVNGAGIVADDDSSMVVVRFFWPTVLAMAAKPGGESWTVVHQAKRISSAVMYGGRFYCTTHRGVTMLDNSRAGLPPRLVLACKWSIRFRFIPMTHSLHLVDNGGELLLVHRMILSNMDPDNSYKYEVYRVDFNAGVLVPTKTLSGRAVFVGLCRAISISAEVFPSVTLDTVYFGTDCSLENRLEGYNTVNGSNQPRHPNWSVLPLTFVDCLSSWIEGSGKHLA